MKDLLGTVRIAVMTPCIKLSVNGKSVRHKAWGTQCANMILANKKKCDVGNRPIDICKQSRHPARFQGTGQPPIHTQRAHPATRGSHSILLGYNILAMIT